MGTLSLFKYCLTIIGERISPLWLLRLQAGLNYMELGRWMHDQGFVFPHRVWKREQVWAAAIKLIGDRPVLYLEFGVFQGVATRFWSRALTHPQTQLHGFDSFEGLPEKFGPWVDRSFDVQGSLPVIEDKRVQFFKGWFDQVLPGYSVPPHELLVINMDADLYSSTIYVLRYLRPWIKSGALLYFDEMNHLEHEPRAFDEFMKESGLRFRPLCADKSLAFVLFECI